MRFTKTIVLFLLISLFANGQESNVNWYSETKSNGIIIQNSFPKGGRYAGSVKEHFNPSYLVFYTRVINETGKSIEMKINFSADSIKILNSPNTFMKLFLPPDKMTPEKQGLFSYGVTELKSLNKSTSFQKKINNKEECLFYVVAFFYQTEVDAQDEDKGGNRAELILEGEELIYRMSPQIDAMKCGYIIFNK